MSKTVKNIMDNNKVCLELVTGRNLQNKEVFAYVLVEKNNLQHFRGSLKNNNTKLADFGVVIAAGEGIPPEGLEEEVLRRVKKEG